MKLNDRATARVSPGFMVVVFRAFDNRREGIWAGFPVGSRRYYRLLPARVIGDGLPALVEGERGDGVPRLVRMGMGGWGDPMGTMGQALEELLGEERDRAPDMGGMLHAIARMPGMGRGALHRVFRDVPRMAGRGRQPAALLMGSEHLRMLDEEEMLRLGSPRAPGWPGGGRSQSVTLQLTDAALLPVLVRAAGGEQ